MSSDKLEMKDQKTNKQTNEKNNNNNKNKELQYQVVNILELTVLIISKYSWQQFFPTH